MLKRGGMPEGGPEIIPFELEADSTAGRNLSYTISSLCTHRLNFFHTMKVQINRKEVETGVGIANLGQLLEKENLIGPGRAVAINNKLVPKSEWYSTSLAEGMNITVIRAVCGG